MKGARIATVALCMLLLVLPSVAIPIFRSPDSGAENRELADFPALIDGEDGLNGDFDEEFEAWLCDHFALRDGAVRLNALANYRLLRTSPNEKVIVGRGDWLYFSETVPDFTGEGRLTDEELARIVGNLRALAESLSRRGATLYIAVVPNKNTLYPQYMPGRYAMRGDGGNIPLLREACADLPAVWIDLAGPLSEAAKGDRLICHRTDTHWNALGAALAAETVLDAMGRESAGWSIDGEAGFSGGDLSRLMGLPGDLRETVPNVVSASPLPPADYDAHEVTVPGDGEGRLVVYRDSFGTAIGPWLARAYGETELRWRYPLDGSRPCDDALLLICERNLRLYLSDAPILAEEDDMPGEAAGDETFEDIEEDDAFFDDVDGEFTEIDGDDDFFGDGEEADDGF